MLAFKDCCTVEHCFEDNEKVEYYPPQPKRKIVVDGVPYKIDYDEYKDSNRLAIRTLKFELTPIKGGYSVNMIYPPNLNEKLSFELEALE